MRLATDRIAACLGLLLALSCWLAQPLSAQEEGNVPFSMQPPPGAEGVNIEQKLGEKIRLDAQFTDSEGKTVALSDFFNRDKPVAITVIYYRCPMLCGLTLSALTEAMHGLDWVPGKEFDVLVISMDPRETAEMAKSQKNLYVERLRKPDAASGWHFMVGSPEAIEQATGDLGFHFNYIESTGEYAHDSGLFLLTPDGRIARVLSGTNYTVQDLKLGLLEAGEGKIGSFLDTIFLRCYHYDPTSGTYRFAISAMRVAGLITIVLLFGPIAFFIWRERRAAQARKAVGAPDPMQTN